MDNLRQIFQVDWNEWIITLFLLLVVGLFIYKLLEEILFEKLGIETKWMRKRREEHDLLITTAQSLKKLSEQHEHDREISDKNDEIIRSDLEKLTNMFIDKKIDDYRWEIINFSSRVSDKQRCSKDAYKHCLRTYEKYEKILEDYGLENGEVEISMEIINDSYKEKLKNGF